jgi:hypothetical protein
MVAEAQTASDWHYLSYTSVYLPFSNTIQYFLLLFLVGWDWVHLVLRPLLAYCTSARWQMVVIVEQLMEWELAGEAEIVGENLSTTNPTWPDPGSNLGRHGGKPTTNLLSYGAVHTRQQLSVL